MTPKKKKIFFFDALDAIFDLTQKKMTPKDAQITLKAPIFFFHFTNLVFEKRKSKKTPPKKKVLENLKTWCVFGSKQSSNVKLTFVLAILCKIKFTDKLAVPK